MSLFVFCGISPFIIQLLKLFVKLLSHVQDCSATYSTYIIRKTAVCIRYIFTFVDQNYLRVLVGSSYACHRGCPPATPPMMICFIGIKNLCRKVSILFHYNKEQKRKCFIAYRHKVTSSQTQSQFHSPDKCLARFHSRQFPAFPRNIRGMYLQFFLILF